GRVLCRAGAPGAPRHARGPRRAPPWAGRAPPPPPPLTWPPPPPAPAPPPPPSWATSVTKPPLVACVDVGAGVAWAGPHINDATAKLPARGVPAGNFVSIRIYPFQGRALFAKPRRSSMFPWIEEKSRHRDNCSHAI